MDRRRRNRRRVALGASIVALVAIIGVVLTGALDGDDDDPGDDRAAPRSTEEVDRVATTLLIGTRTDERDDARVVWLLLLSSQRDPGSGAAVYIPSHTAVEVPGRGLQGLGDSWETGGVPLLLVSVENLLGITVDGYVELESNDALVLFENVGELTVDVPSDVRVPAGRDQVRLLLSKGRQSLDPGFIVDLLYRVGVDGDDIELGGRHLALWDALFDAHDGDPGVLADAVSEAAGALASSDLDPDRLADRFAEIAALPSTDRTVRSLPVTPLEVPGDRLYAVDSTVIEDFVAEVVGDAAGGEDLVRVQVLNGNGVPGIGQEVAARLVGHGFRVILSGNAPRLNYAKTRVVTYDSSEAGQARARRARDLLGVGEVQISRQEQGIVDLTIVVGKDFLRTR